MPFLLLMTLLAAGDARLEQGEKLLAAQDCDGLHQLFAPTAATRSERNLDAARLLVRGAAACRSKDKVVTFALTQRALALAPDDYGVRTAHAESLLRVGERSAAARLLDETIQAHPQDAVRARFLRAQLADTEAESALVVWLLEPLVNDPEYGPRVRPLLERNRAALRAHSEARDSLRRQEQEATRAQEEAASHTSPPAPKAPRSGSEVWSASATVKSGGQRTFRTKNIRAGGHYVFHATGACTAPAKKSRKSRLGPTVDLFGQDFRVRIGTLEPMPLEVGLQPRQSALPFRAPTDNPQIFIEDRTTQREDRPRCTIRDVAVRVP